MDGARGKLRARDARHSRNAAGEGRARFGGAAGGGPDEEDHVDSRGLFGAGSKAGGAGAANFGDDVSGKTCVGAPAAGNFSIFRPGNAAVSGRFGGRGSSADGF